MSCNNMMNSRPEQAEFVLPTDRIKSAMEKTVQDRRGGAALFSANLSDLGCVFICGPIEIYCFFLTATAVFAILCWQKSERQGLYRMKILSIGNSFSADTSEHLASVALHAGAG